MPDSQQKKKASRKFNPRNIWSCFLPTESCRCGQGAGGRKKDCSCDGHNLCATREWVQERTVVEEPDGPTLQTLTAGDRARIEKLCLPPTLKKRLLSMGLTGGTEVAVINKEGGRMIIAVRDSRLGLSPELAARITCHRVAGGV